MTAPLPPGPRGHLLSGNLPEFRAARLEFMTRCVRDFGDVVGLRLGYRRVYLVCGPEAIESVLVTNARNFTKHFALRLNPSVLGNGLLTSEGDFWLRQRRLAQPAFTKLRVAAYAPAMVAAAERMTARWVEGETRDLLPEMLRLTLEIASETLFGATVGDEARDIGEALTVLQESFLARFNSLLPPPRWLPIPRNIRLWRAVRRLDAIIYRFIRERRASQAERGDVLSLLLHARDEGGRMSDKQLRDEAMTLFLAGHETTALGLAWTWYLLASHPHVEEALLAELRDVLGDRPPTADDLPRLRITERVLLESMRVYPPVYTLGREAVSTCEVGGYRVPAGTTLLMSQWVVHRDPRFWDQPDAFIPQRWADVNVEKLPKFAYFPFGGGPRLCIGNNFALQEMALVLATVAPRFRFDLVPGHAVVPWPTFTLRPRDGIRATLRRR